MEELIVEENIQFVIEWGMKIVSAVLILIVGWMLGKWASSSVKKINALDGTLRSFFAGLAKYAIFAISIVTILSQLGVETASLLTVLGAAGLAIGLALQGTLSNVAAGIMLLVLRPFHVGDFISFGGTMGTVKSLNLFGTELSTPDNVYIFSPNSSIWNTQITNYSRNDTRRQDIVMGISYDDDIDKAIKVLKDVIAKDERVLKTDDKLPEVRVDSLGDSSVNILVRLWTARTDFIGVKWDLQKALKEALDKNGLNIPFPTRTLVFEGGGDLEDKKPAKSTKTAKKAA